MNLSAHYNNLLKMALEFAKEAHKGQTRKNGCPYYEDHILGLQNLLDGDFSIIHHIILALHDTVEDCGVEEKDLRDLFPSHVVDNVMLLTIDKNKDEREEVEKCKVNQVALVCRLLDRLQNLQTTRFNLVVNNEINKKNIDFIEKMISKTKELYFPLIEDIESAIYTTYIKISIINELGRLEGLRNYALNLISE